MNGLNAIYQYLKSLKILDFHFPFQWRKCGFSNGMAFEHSLIDR